MTDNQSTGRGHSSASDFDQMYRALALVVIVAVTAYIGIVLTREGGRIAAIWIPNAIVLALLLRQPYRKWPALLGAAFLGNLVADLGSGDDWPTGIGLSVCNAIEVTVGVLLFRRLVSPGEQDFAQSRSLAVFGLSCVIVGPVISATAASIVLLVTHDVPFAEIWPIWFMADALGILAFTPLVLAADGRELARIAQRGKIWEHAGAVLLTVIVSVIVFYQTRYPLLFILIPVLILPAFSLGFAATAMAATSMTLVAVVLTVLGGGPFHLNDALSQRERILALQIFVVVANLTALPVAAALEGRRRMEHDLAQNQELLRRIIDSIPAMVAYWDVNLNNRFANAAYRDWFGIAPDQMMAGMHIGALLGEKVFKLNLPYMLAALRGEPQSFERELVSPSGKRRFAQAHYIPDIKNSEAQGFYVLVFDVSQQKEVQVALEKAADIATNAARAKSDFLSAMSHELRTPLNSILGFTDLMMTQQFGEMSPKEQEFMTIIRSSAEHLLRLINDVLELSKIEAGRISLSMEPVDVVPVIKSVVASLRPIAEKAGVELKEKYAGVERPAVRADRTRLYQALVNLCSNAIKYNRRGGGVEFAIEELPAGAVRIKVKDTGRGVPADRIQDLFQPFQRLGAELGPVEGTGIGLSLTKRLVELMDGQVGVESQENLGSTFWIDLQSAATSISKTVADDTNVLQVSVEGTETAMRILYVEDNENNRQLMRNYLALIPGVELVEASTGDEGIQLIRNYPFGLIFLDINLPGASGYDILAEIRALPSHNGTPVIALSANAMPMDKARGLDAGFDRYLAKPARLQEVLDVVRARMEALQRQ